MDIPFDAKLIYLKPNNGFDEEAIHTITALELFHAGEKMYLRARDHATGAIKTFLLDRIAQLTSLQTGEIIHVKKASETRPRSRIVDSPQNYFEGWVFRIDRHHYETMGLRYRMFIRNKKPHWAWSEMVPPSYLLLPGYIFYEHADSNHYLQIGAALEDGNIEIHEGRMSGNLDRSGYLVTEQQLADWLRTGRRDMSAKTIDTATSKAGLMAWQLNQNSARQLDFNAAKE